MNGCDAEWELGSHAFSQVPEAAGSLRSPVADQVYIVLAVAVVAARGIAEEVVEPDIAVAGVVIEGVFVSGPGFAMVVMFGLQWSLRID